MSIGIDFGIGIDQNSWYRTGIVSKPKKLVSPITIIWYNLRSGLYLVEPPQLHFNLPITPRTLTFIQETSCKLFVNT